MIITEPYEFLPHKQVGAYDLGVRVPPGVVAR
jgi:hypothetical protein